MKYTAYALALLALVSLMPLRLEAITTDLGRFPTEDYSVGLNLKQGNVDKDGHLEFWSRPGDDLNWLPAAPGSRVLGSSLVGINFSASAVDVLGASFSVRQTHSSSAQGAVRVHGYRNGVQIGVTAWFTNLGVRPNRFAFDLPDVDRIVIESKPLPGRGLWYKMKDLTVEPVPEPSSILALLAGLLVSAGIAHKRRK